MPRPVAVVSRLRGLARLDKAKWLARKVWETGPAEYRAWVRRLPLRAHTVLYESFAGNGMLCHPEALFRGLLADPDQQHLKHVWVLDEPKEHPATVAEFADDPRVRFVRRGSPAYIRALATAGLLVNNATFPAHFGKRPGQVYVNTWHGTPLKAMGYDEPQGAVGARNVLRNFMMADYLLSTCQFMSERMYEDAYRLRNVAPGTIIEEGSPRTDRQRLDGAGQAGVRSRLRRGGVSLDDSETLILYAPTWKGESFHTPVDDVRELGARMTELERLLPPGHRVLVKVHQQLARIAHDDPSVAGRLVPNDVPTNEVLGVTDVLVTDYSSVMFDFVATGRPIVLFTPDLEHYAGSRGLYLGADELPGPLTSTVVQIASVIRAIGSGTAPDPAVTHNRAYAATRARFAPHDDGAVTERVLDILVRGQAHGRRMHPVRRDGRPTILIHLGGMMTNGITSSALNLLHHLDHDALDVSIIRNHSPVPERVANVARIDPRVRQFIRIGGFASGKVNYLRQRRLISGHVDDMDPSVVVAIDTTLEAEWARTVGSATFDHVIDFSGYSPLWAFLVANAPAGVRSIWMHNDLLADQLREVDGRRPHEANLRGVFSSYRRFDRLVSVSESLRQVNASKLGKWAPAERFVACRNVIDHERVRAEAVLDPLPDVAHALGRGFTFVTVGRVSPEKNHVRLVESLADIHGKIPETSLVIIGTGPIMSRVRSRADELGVGDAVAFTRGLANPWSVMSRCDCFVLSSDYEGQPMAILEARTLGLPVVATDFDTVASALPTGEGLVVPRNTAGVAAGMRAALADEVPRPHFDAVAYNAVVLEEFYDAIGLEVGRQPGPAAGRPSTSSRRSNEEGSGK
ncbi:MAG: CDP-glycerol glycerophosphotransferase family protein [Micrococcales bacterium]|nr:CDP-glycerol glycerophosphotransferase family protein [Micrococcales bacterium]